MFSGIRNIVVFFVVSHACLTAGILRTKVLRNSETTTSLPSPAGTYFPTVEGTLPKLPEHGPPARQTLDNDLEDGRSPRYEAQANTGYLYLQPPSDEFKLPLKEKKIKSFANPRPLQKVQGVRVTVPADHQPHVPRRSSYQVVEEHDEYLTDDSDHAGLPYRGKVQTTYPHRDSQDITTAIKALDHFLSGALNDDGYNSVLHPPPNPVLALVLSRYGRYVPGSRNPRVYSYMAVNNIHNNKPFGSYKLECDDEPIYVVR